MGAEIRPIRDAWVEALKFDPIERVKVRQLASLMKSGASFDDAVAAVRSATEHGFTLAEGL